MPGGGDPGDVSLQWQIMLHDALWCTVVHFIAVIVGTCSVFCTRHGVTML